MAWIAASKSIGNITVRPRSAHQRRASLSLTDYHLTLRNDSKKVCVRYDL